MKTEAEIKERMAQIQEGIAECHKLIALPKATREGKKMLYRISMQYTEKVNLLKWVLDDEKNY